MGALSSRHILITAGPTQEPLDPVRYLGNRSSGRLGYAMARVARDRGARVTLVSGPTSLRRPARVQFIGVETAREMEAACRKAARSADIIIMAAAVADYRPQKPTKTKLKRGTATLHIELAPNPDILAGLCKRRRKGQLIVGFALETNDLLKNARKKLRAKGCDMIIANPASALTSTLHHATIVYADGTQIPLPGMRKEKLARQLIRIIATANNR